MSNKLNRVCVTGSTGYVGSWVCRTLIERGYNVRAVIRDPQNEKEMIKTTHLIEYCKDLSDRGTVSFHAIPDIRESNGYKDAFEECKYVIHCAHPVSVLGSTNRFISSFEKEEKDEREFFMSHSIQGTRTLLSSALESGVQKVVLTSSITACTGGRRRRSFGDYFSNEYECGLNLDAEGVQDPLWCEDDWSHLLGGGNSAYSDSKTAVERYAFEYRSNMSESFLNQKKKPLSSSQKGFWSKWRNVKSRFPKVKSTSDFFIPSDLEDDYDDDFDDDDDDIFDDDDDLTRTDPHKKQRPLQITSILPSFCIGPVLCESHLLSSTPSSILGILQNGFQDPSHLSKFRPFVDVRDVADAHIAAMEARDSDGHRFIASHANEYSMYEICQMIDELYPGHQWPLPKDFPDKRLGSKPFIKNEKLLDLIVKDEIIHPKESLQDMIDGFIQFGALSYPPKT